MDIDIQLQLILLLFTASICVLFVYGFKTIIGTSHTVAWDDTVAHHWARRMGLDDTRHDNSGKYSERFAASPGKMFFSARRVMRLEEERFFAEGVRNDRKVWLYRITGAPFSGSGVGTVRNLPAQSSFTVSGISPVSDDAAVDSERVFYGWCLEVQTKHIPQRVMVTRKFIAGTDSYVTESRDFEKQYEISQMNDSMMLQLLDPAMMDHIMQSKCAAIEISDASVALYYTLPKISAETIDNMFDHAMKIAVQVDRNFPLEMEK